MAAEVACTRRDGAAEPIINLLNERFGTHLTEAEQVWFDQQVRAAAKSDDLRRVAEHNTEEQFGYVFDRQFENVVMDRQAANDDLFRMFFDKPESSEASLGPPSSPLLLI